MRSLIGLLVVLFSSSAISQEYQATYQLTFVSDWSPATHPIDYPNTAHFSALIGNTHNSAGSIWNPGGLASAGIENMAETGSTLRLSMEINDMIAAGTSEFRLLGSAIGPVDNTSFQFTVTESHPLVSLTTMIAPSPDWFVGIHDLNLMRSGMWVEELMVDLLPYDSGTDSGLTFTSADQDTDPADPITRISVNPLPDDVPLGAFVLTRLSTTGTPPEVIFVNTFE